MPKKKILKVLNKFIINYSFSGVIIAFILFLFVILFSFSDFYKIIELKFYDLRFNIKPAINQWDKISLVEIDDNSIFHVGKFPWPRYIYADAVDKLNSLDCNSIIFDIEFPDESSFTVLDEMVSFIENNNEDFTLSKDMILNNLILNNDKIFSNSLKKYNNIFLPFSFQKFIKKERDETISEKKYKFQQETYGKFLNEASVVVKSEDINKYKSLFDKDRKSIAFPTPVLSQTTKNFGFVDSDFDLDGSSRRIRLVRLFENRLFFNLSFVAAAKILKVELNNIIVNPGSSIILKNAKNPVSGKVEDISIPIDQSGHMLINWAPGEFSESFNHVPFFAIIEYEQVKTDIHFIYFDIDKNLHNNKLKNELVIAKDLLDKKRNENNFATQVKLQAELDKRLKSIAKIKKEYIKEFEKLKKDEILTLTDEQEINDSVSNLNNIIEAEKLVRKVEGLTDSVSIMGLIATGTQDIGITPVSSNYWMVGSYPNIINTILQESFIKKAPNYVNFVLFLIIAIMISIRIKNLSAKRSLLTIISSFFIINIIIISLFSFLNLWIDQFGTNLAFLLPSLSILAIKFLEEESQKRFIKGAFSRYLSTNVIESIIKNPETLHLGGKDRDITIYFSDIQSFSTISEKLTPTQLVKLLNEYLSEMTDIILKNNGTVDKFEGDAIMAFYGAPQFHANHPMQAASAAIEMQKRLIDLRKSWQKRNMPLLHVRMGMNTGNAVVGNMGSKDRMDYTAMGDSVNLASRLEGANKFYGTFNMISSNTYNQLNDKISCRELDTIRVVGKEEPIKVFELIDLTKNLKDKSMEMLYLYHLGLDKFKERDWKESKSNFNKVLKIFKDDGPSKTYIKRCTEFMKKGPSKNWDGVYTLKSK